MGDRQSLLHTVAHTQRLQGSHKGTITNQFPSLDEASTIRANLRVLMNLCALALTIYTAKPSNVKLDRQPRRLPKTPLWATSTPDTAPELNAVIFFDCAV